METQTCYGTEQHNQLQTTHTQKVYFSTLLGLGPRFLLFGVIPVFPSILKSAKKWVGETCSRLQNSPFFSLTISFKRCKARAKTECIKLTAYFFASLPSLIRFLASLQTSLSRTPSLPSTGIRREVGVICKRYLFYAQISSERELKNPWNVFDVASPAVKKNRIIASHTTASETKSPSQAFPQKNRSRLDFFALPFDIKFRLSKSTLKQSTIFRI